MYIGVVYPQTELRGDPNAVRRIGLAVEELGLTAFWPTTTCSVPFTPIEHVRCQAPTASATRSTIRS
jgi:hypothetical protein